MRMDKGILGATKPEPSTASPPSPNPTLRCLTPQSPSTVLLRSRTPNNFKMSLAGVSLCRSRMPRPKIPSQSDFPYSLGARCINKEWFKLPLPEVWEIFCNRLYTTERMFQVKIHSFVLMSNHFHLLMSTPEANLSESMKYLMNNTSLDISRRARRINQTFGGRYFRSMITKDHHFTHAYKYIYRNPVSAGLCRRVEDYPFSTLRGLLGLSRLQIPIADDPLLFNDPAAHLKWLNKAPLPSNHKVIYDAMKRGRFSLRLTPRSGEPHRLESDRF